MQTSPHLCHRCGNRLQEDAAFCAQCGAPQIRVNLPDAALPAPETTATQPMASISPASPPPNKINWQRGFLAALVPSIGAIVLLMINPFFSYSFFVWIGLAGYLSVLLYRRRDPAALINGGAGARLGAVVGLLCFILQGILTLIGYMVATASGHNLRALLIDQMHKSAAANSNPDAAKLVDQFLGRPEAFTLLLIMVVVVLFASFLLCAILGGALGGISQSRNRPRT